MDLTHGSLLVMRGSTHVNWLHRIHKTAKPVEEPINLTFRKVVAPRRAWHARPLERRSRRVRRCVR